MEGGAPQPPHLVLTGIWSLTSLGSMPSITGPFCLCVLLRSRFRSGCSTQNIESSLDQGSVTLLSPGCPVLVITLCHRKHLESLPHSHLLSSLSHGRNISTWTVSPKTFTQDAGDEGDEGDGAMPLFLPSSCPLFFLKVRALNF